MWSSFSHWHIIIALCKIFHVNLIELYVRQCEQSVELGIKMLLCKREYYIVALSFKKINDRECLDYDEFFVQYAI